MYNINKNHALFIIGLFSQIAFRLIGVWRLSDFIILIFFLINIKECLKALNIKSFRKLIIFSTIALLGIIISDIITANTLQNTMKGALMWGLIIPNFFVFYYLLKQDFYRVRYYIYGYIISAFFITFFPTMSQSYFAFGEGENALRILRGEDNQGFLQEYLKYAIPIAIFIVFFFYQKYQKFTSLFLILFGIFCLFAGSRYRFLISEISAIILLILGKITPENSNLKFKRYKSKLPKLILIVLCTLFITQSLYKYAATSGLLGDRAQQKYITQSSSELGILSGRSEFFAGLYAVYKSPIIGYGSYARDLKGLSSDFYRSILGDLDYQSDFEGIKSHSFIIGFWVQGGILTVFIWFFIIKQTILFLRKNICYDYRLTAYLLLVSFILLWDIFFSPFSNRIENSITIILIILTNNYAKNSKNIIQETN